jgi:hypothetical protein
MPVCQYAAHILSRGLDSDIIGRKGGGGGGEGKEGEGVGEVEESTEMRRQFQNWEVLTSLPKYVTLLRTT